MPVTPHAPVVPARLQAAAPTYGGTSPGPVAQLAPAFVTLAPAAAPGTSQALSIRLAPVELGRIEIRIDRPEAGPTRIKLSVERPDTLQTLMNDDAGLSRTLDLAGIPADRTVQFTLAAPDPAPGSVRNNAADGFGAPGFGASGAGTSGSGASGFGSPANSGSPGGGFGGGSPWSGGGAADDDAPRQGSTRRWRMGAGIDITA